MWAISTRDHLAYIIDCVKIIHELEIAENDVHVST